MRPCLAACITVLGRLNQIGGCVILLRRALSTYGVLAFVLVDEELPITSGYSIILSGVAA